MIYDEGKGANERITQEKASETSTIKITNDAAWELDYSAGQTSKQTVLDYSAD